MKWGQGENFKISNQLQKLGSDPNTIFNCLHITNLNHDLLDICSKRSVFISERLYFHRLVCRCKIDSKKNGFKHFGIHYWGECWGYTENDAVNSLGQSKNCYTTNYTSPCEVSTNKFCTGAHYSAYFYEVLGKYKNKKMPLLV